uniref:uncharacterized protein n=1 Tax=Pristiophorus japonicus TaxID=55135 RepID=UPI00398E9317
MEEPWSRKEDGTQQARKNLNRRRPGKSATIDTLGSEGRCFDGSCLEKSNHHCTSWAHTRERNLRPTMTRLKLMQKMIPMRTSLKRRTSSNPTFQTKSMGEGMDEAPIAVLTLEELQVLPIEVPAPSLSGMTVGGTFHGFSPSQAAGPSGMQRATSSVRRGRRARQRSSELQDLTDVVQMMAMSAECIDLTQSLLDSISEVGDEMLGEVTTLSRNGNNVGAQEGGNVAGN